MAEINDIANDKLGIIDYKKDILFIEMLWVKLCYHCTFMPIATPIQSTSFKGNQLKIFHTFCQLHLLWL